MIQEKEIVVTNLSQKTISPKPGANGVLPNWKAFTSYMIQGNDGRTYETTDHKYYADLRMGQHLVVKFETITKNVNGRVYTSYRIPLEKVMEKKENDSVSVLALFKKEIIDRIEEMEHTILAALKANPTSDVPPDDDFIFEEPKY